MAPAGRRVGTGGTHYYEPIYAGLAHRADDIAGADRIRVDGLAGERHTERRQHGVGAVDNPGEAIAPHVRAGDRQPRIGDGEVVGPPRHSHRRVTSVEHATREQSSGHAIGAKDHDLHENSFDSYRRRVAVACRWGRAGIRTAPATQCNAVNISWVPRFAGVRKTGTMDSTRTTRVSAIQTRRGDVV